MATWQFASICLSSARIYSTILITYAKADVATIEDQAHPETRLPEAFWDRIGTEDPQYAPGKGSEKIDGEGVEKSSLSAS